MLNNKRQRVWISRIIFVLLMIMLISGCKRITPETLTSTSSIKQDSVTTLIEEPLTTILTTTTVKPKFTTTIPFVTNLAREYVCDIYRGDEEIDIFDVTTASNSLLIQANVHLSSKDEANQKTLDLIRALSIYLAQYNKGITLNLPYYSGTIGAGIPNTEVQKIASDINYFDNWKSQYYLHYGSYRSNYSQSFSPEQYEGCK